MKLERICQYCNTSFIARTSVTKYCGDKCAKRAYKQKIKNKKIEVSNEETKRFKDSAIEELKVKLFLSVNEVASLLGCSRQNVYKMINSGKLEATNLLEKKTIIKRSDLDKLFNKPKESTQEAKQEELEKELNDWKQITEINLSDCYTITEVLQNFNITDSALNNLIKRHKILKIKSGWYVYVPKQIIEKLLS